MHSLELKRTNETGLVDFIDFFLGGFVGAEEF